ncbi:MAG: hypothetical protein WCY36_07855, partial [Candidatus Omnitrophota bacterium]
MKKIFSLILAIAVLSSFNFTAYAASDDEDSGSNTLGGAVVGGLLGGGVGTAIGSISGNAGKGALWGAGIGAVGGALLGSAKSSSKTNSDSNMAEPEYAQPQAASSDMKVKKRIIK